MLALKELGHDIFLKSTNGVDRVDDRIRPYLVDEVDPNDYNITYTIPLNLPRFKARRRIEIYNYETTILPAGWADLLNRYTDLILPSSTFQKRIFEKNGVDSKKIHVIPHGIEADLFNPSVPPFDLKNNKFKFLSVGIPHARKGFDVLLQSFAEEFASTEPVCLIIKTRKKMDPRTRHHYEINIMDEIARVQKNAKTAEIILISGDYKHLAGLYTACDCYISPTRSEGFGMTMLEAIACFPSGTLIQKSNSLVEEIQDIKVNDLVITHLGNSKSVTKIVQRKYCGDLVKITTLLSNKVVKVTTEHPVYICRNNELQWKKASQLRIGDCVVYPKPKLSNIVKESFLISSYVKNLQKKNGKIYRLRGRKPNGFSLQEIANILHLKKFQVFRVINNKIGVSNEIREKVKKFLISNPYRLKDSKQYTNRIILNEEFGRLLGYYIAEGSITTPYTVCFSFHCNEVQYHNDVIFLMKKIFGLEVTINTNIRKSVTNLYFSSTIINDLFKRLAGNGAKNKVIPKWIVNTSVEFRQNLLLAMIRGDGYISLNETKKYLRHVSYSTISQQLAFQLRFLLWQLGLSCSFRSGYKKNSKNEQFEIKIGGKQLESINEKIPGLKRVFFSIKGSRQRYLIDEKYIYMPITKIEKEKYNGLVYNFEVDQDNSYVADHFAVHNCNIPVIATGYGGHMDYLDNTTSYLINYKIVPAIRGTQYWHYDRRATIAQPDKEHLKKLMRHVYNNRKEAEQKATKARDTIISRYSWKRIAEQVTEVIEKQKWDPKSFSPIYEEKKEIKQEKYQFDYSIVIPNYNKADLTIKCVDSILKTTQEKFQIIIVDNGSSMSELKKLANRYERKAQISCLRNEQNLGFAKACNAGMTAALGQYIVLLNNDTEILDPDWLQKMRATLDAGIWATGAAGGIHNEELDFVKEIRTNDEPISYICGWCLMFKADLVKKVGHMCEEFGLAFYEDSITSDRCVVVQNEEEQIEVITIEELFNKFKNQAKEINGREVIDLTKINYKALSFNNDNSGKTTFEERLTLKEIEGYNFYKQTGIKAGYTDNGIYYDLKRIEKSLKATNNLVDGKWNKIKQIVRHKVNKEISFVSQKYGSVCVTEDHSLIITQDKGYDSLSYKKLQIGDKLTKIVKIPEVEQIWIVDILDYLSADVKDFLEWDDDFIWDKDKKKTSNVKCRRRFTNPKDVYSLVRLIAAYISEGSSSRTNTRKNKKQGEFNSVICNIYNSDIEWLKERIVEYKKIFIQDVEPNISCMNKKGSKTVDQVLLKKDVYRINFNGGKLIGFILEGLCQVRSGNKKIPSFMYHVTDQVKRSFLKVIIEGDGNRLNKKTKSTRNYSKEYIEKSFMYTTKSLQLVSGLSVLLTQLGIKFSINHKDFVYYCLRTIKNRQNNTNLEFRKMKREYNDYVYDLSVEKAENFVDGCGLIVLHNSTFSYRIKQLGGTIAVTEGINIKHLDHTTAREMNLRETYVKAREIFKKKWLVEGFDTWLQREDLPLVSILTLTHNGLNYLKDAVESVLKNTKYPNWEWMIADNGSTDDTVKYLKSIRDPRIKLIERKTNNGNFASINNELALQAKGKYLVFLNNDVIVTENWLSHMVFIADNDPNVGCVGSRLLYPDCRVQHCGVIFQVRTKYPGHLFVHIPQGQVMEYLEEDREYQSVTAACSLVPAKDFRAVKMFDTKFHYVFEDVDLCLKLRRELNKKVIYASKSIVFHLESATRERTKKKEEEDQRVRPYLKMLVDKWGPEIAGDVSAYYMARVQKMPYMLYNKDGIQQISVPEVVIPRMAVKDVIKAKDGVELSFVTCVSNKVEYEKNVVRSLDSSIKKNFELVPVYNEENKYSAAQALNIGIEKAKANIIITCHQDVIFDADFTVRFIEKIGRYLNFGTLGVAGITYDEKTAGGVRFPTDYRFAIYPEAEVMINDELCLALRKNTGLRFDEKVFDGFHFYGSDLCLQALDKGLKNYAVNCGVIHLSVDGAGNIDELKRSYFPTLVKLRDKWKNKFRKVKTTSGYYNEEKIGTFIEELQSEEPKYNK